MCRGRLGRLQLGPAVGMGMLRVQLGSCPCTCTRLHRFLLVQIHLKLRVTGVCGDRPALLACPDRQQESPGELDAMNQQELGRGAGGGRISSPGPGSARGDPGTFLLLPDPGGSLYMHVSTSSSMAHLRSCYVPELPLLRSVFG